MFIFIYKVVFCVRGKKKKKMAPRSRNICTLLCLVSSFLDTSGNSSHSQGIVELKIQMSLEF